jgi:integrase
VKRVLADGGLVGPGYAAHVLRATAATLAYRQGANRFDVMTLLRHADPATTDPYIDGLTDVPAAERWRADGAPTMADLSAGLAKHGRQQKTRRQRAA